MNPSSNEALGGPLPAPAEQLLVVPAKPSETGRKSPEKAPAAAETAPAPASPGRAAPPLLPLPALAAASATTLAAQDNTNQTSAAVPANDDDLIEKEWVNKAKAIVERTRDDPHKQSEELTLVKADYMQQHYNKTIKLNK